jgi:hypothetical protein
MLRDECRPKKNLSRNSNPHLAKIPSKFDNVEE